MIDSFDGEVEKVNEKKGVAIFTLEDTLFHFDFSGWTENSHGIRLLKSCSKVDHFVVIISVERESERNKLSNLISSSTGMKEGIDFVLCLFSDSDIFSQESENRYYTSVVATWVGYCAGQNRRVTAGVSCNIFLIEIMKEHEIKTVFCDSNSTEVEEFCLLGDESVVSEQKNNHKPINKNKKSPDWQSDRIFDGDPAIEQAVQFPEYFKQLPEDWEFVDVYRVDELFPISLPGASRLYHARKKLMIPGLRTGGKVAYKDVQEAVVTLQGWLRDHAPKD